MPRKPRFYLPGITAQRSKRALLDSGLVDSFKGPADLSINYNHFPRMETFLNEVRGFTNGSG